MADDCGCVKTFDGAGNPTTSSLVTWNGQGLCTGLSEGTLNDIIVSIAQYCCTSRNLIDTMTLDDIKVTLTTIGADCIAALLPSNPTLHDLWLIQNAQICSLITSLGALDSDDVVLATLPDTNFTNCVGIIKGDTITSTLVKILNYFCTGFVQESEFYASGKLASPLLPFAKGVPVITDASTGGVAKVHIAAQNYWCDGNNIVKSAETIALSDSADNYIYLNETYIYPAIINFAYSVSAVAIGGAAPTTTGVKCYKIRTGTGTVTSMTTLLDIYPINDTLIADDSIKARHLYSDVVHTAGGLKQESDGSLSVYVDNTTLDLSTNKVEVKDDGITAAKLYSDIAYNHGGLKQETSGALSANPDLTSIGLNGFYKISSLQMEPGAGTSSLKQLGGGGTAAGVKSASLNAGNATGDFSTAVNSGTSRENYSFASGAGVAIHKYSRALACPAVINPGSNQKIETCLKVETTDATPTIATIDGSALFTIPIDSTCYFKIMVSAAQTAGSSGTVGDSLGQSFEGLIKNISGVTSLVSTVVTGAPIIDGAFAGLVGVTANDTTDSLDITVTGEANKTINWTASVTAVLTGFNTFTL